MIFEILYFGILPDNHETNIHKTTRLIIIVYSDISDPLHLFWRFWPKNKRQKLQNALTIFSFALWIGTKRIDYIIFLFFYQPSKLPSLITKKKLWKFFCGDQLERIFISSCSDSLPSGAVFWSQDLGRDSELSWVQRKVTLSPLARSIGSLWTNSDSISN